MMQRSKMSFADSSANANGSRSARASFGASFKSAVSVVGAVFAVSIFVICGILPALCPVQGAVGLPVAGLLISVILLLAVAVILRSLLLCIPAKKRPYQSVA